MNLIKADKIKNKIFSIRDKQVILDYDLAELYQVETRLLNQAVKRNIERFPENFRFQLTNEEFENLISQFVISSSFHGGRRKNPYVYTEQGVAMLSAVLKSKVAVSISIKIITTFVEMRKIISNEYLISKKFEQIDNKLNKYDENFNLIFNALENKDIKKNKGIFYQGQIFDSYVFISDLIKSAKTDLILIDNFIDESVLVLLDKCNKKVKIKIYTNLQTKKIELDYAKYKQQYKRIEVKHFNKSHDRFLIIDRKDLYHIGASIKDLGKKWFAFSKMNSMIDEVINKLNE